MTTWDAARYLQYADQRTRPARELLARVPLTDPALVVDLGAGPATSTRVLLDAYPGARVVAVDSSPQMLARARADLSPAELTRTELVEADVTRWTPDRPVDLVFANALLQWLPDHLDLLPRLLACLAPGGALAFQVPDNLAEPSHRLMRELPGPWSTAVAAVAPRAVIAPPDRYYDALVTAGAVRVDVWRTTDELVMASPAAIVDWVRGTGLRPFLEAVPTALQDDYLAAYTAAIDAAYPARHDGARLFSFPRRYVVATRD